MGWRFSPAPNTKSPELLVPNPEETSARLKLLWLSCGDEDNLKQISDRTHAYLSEYRVPHVWYEESGGHDWPVWKNDLYHFSQLILKITDVEGSLAPCWPGFYFQPKRKGKIMTLLPKDIVSILDQNGIKAADLLHGMECDRLPEGGFSESYLVLSREHLHIFRGSGVREEKTFSGYAAGRSKAAGKPEQAGSGDWAWERIPSNDSKP